MPTLKDSQGNLHTSYKSLYLAEARYKRETVKASKVAVKKSVGTKRKTSKYNHDDIFIKTTPKKAESVKTSPKYYCLNCGEAVKHGDTVCATCGITLAWAGIE